MEIFFIIIGAIILLLGILLILPVKIYLAYEDDFVFEIKYLGFTLFDVDDKEKNSKKTSAKKAKNKKNKNKPKKTNNHKSITDVIKYYGNIISLVFKRLHRIMRFIKIRKFVFDLSIATDDAAKTAIEYGEVCCVVYPIISFIEANTNFKLKTNNINIRPDFDSKDSKFKVSVLVKAKLIICLIAIAALLWDYTKKQREESENNE